ncbi:MAG: ribosomal-processing cysteine protease Prp [Spirochaetaceae bacterium]|nr:ribosomal-processing cysteine protease Prp [Spirochaetaceae bacterium]
MIRISLGCSDSGEFRSCEADGHAGFAQKGRDIVCSAVSELLRTAGQVLSDTSGILVDSETGFRGKLQFGIKNPSDISKENAVRLICIADFIRTGISSVERDYPQCVQLKEYKTDF